MKKENVKKIADAIGLIAGMTEACTSGMLIGAIGGAAIDALPGGKVFKIAGKTIVMVGGTCAAIGLAPWFTEINQVGARIMFNCDIDDVTAADILMILTIMKHKGRDD